MKKRILISEAVTAWNLPSAFLVECMADAEALPQTHGDFDFRNYRYASGQELCIVIFATEILAVTTEEAENGGWISLNSKESRGIADVQRYLRYLKQGPS